MGGRVIEEVSAEVRELRETWAAMSEIEAIVRASFDEDNDVMAVLLRQYAMTSTPAHSLAWVAKKAHDAMSLVLWETFHAPLNAKLGLPAGYVG